MKKPIVVFAVLCMASLSFAAHTIRNAKGWSGTVTSAGTNITVVAGARRISVYNSGSNTLYVSVNGLVADLTNDVANGVAFPILASGSHGFGIGDFQQFNTIQLAVPATGGTASAIVGAY